MSDDDDFDVEAFKRQMLADMAAEKESRRTAFSSGQLSQHGIEPAERHGYTPVPESEWREVQSRGRGATFTPQRISTSTPVHTGQPGVYRDTVEHYAANPHLIQRQDDPVEVIHDPLSGKLYMGQGHHRLAAARLAGKKTIKAHVYQARREAD